MFSYLDKRDIQKLATDKLEQHRQKALKSDELPQSQAPLPQLQASSAPPTKKDEEPPIRKEIKF